MQVKLEKREKKKQKHKTQKTTIMKGQLFFFFFLHKAFKITHSSRLFSLFDDAKIKLFFCFPCNPNPNMQLTSGNVCLATIQED